MKKANSFDNYHKPFPTTLRTLIERKKTTIKAVADNIGVTRQAVSQYQDGSTQPNAETIVKMAEFFNVTTDYLLTGKNKDIDESFNIACDYTGLSSKSVELLRQLKTIDKDNELSAFFENETGKAFLISIIRYTNQVKHSAQFRGWLAGASDEPFMYENKKSLLDEILDESTLSTIQQYEIIAFRISQILQRYFDERSKEILQPVVDFEIKRNDELKKVQSEVEKMIEGDGEE